MSASTPAQWTREKFLEMTVAEETIIKKELATHLGLSYNGMNQENKKIASNVSSIPQYDPDIVKKMAESMATGKPKLEDTTYTTVVNGCLVNWHLDHGKYNAGYVYGEKIQQMVKDWDVNVERRGGGYQHAAKFDAQYFALTNMSSLAAMLSEVVYEWKTSQKLSPELARAFTSIRVTLYVHASSMEIAMLNADENVAQFERKQHNDLDTLFLINAVRKRVDAMPTKTLDQNSALDVCPALVYRVRANATRAPAQSAHAFMSCCVDRQPCE